MTVLTLTQGAVHMTTYAVKVDGKGIILKTIVKSHAEKRAAECVSQAHARVLTITDNR